MSNVFPSFQLKGCLHLELDQHLIKMECEGQSIKLTFSSFSALKKCLSFTRMLNGKQFRFLIQDYAKNLKLTYYLNDLFIGESRSDLEPSWVGRYIGLEKSKIYPRQLLTYFLRFS